MEIQAEDLNGKALAFAVVMSTEAKDFSIADAIQIVTQPDGNGVIFQPHLDESQAAPIIDEAQIKTLGKAGENNWLALIGDDEDGDVETADGPTRLIAAMRCYVKSVLSEVEIPDELLDLDAAEQVQRERGG